MRVYKTHQKKLLLIYPLSFVMEVVDREIVTSYRFTIQDN